MYAFSFCFDYSIDFERPSQQHFRHAKERERERERERDRQTDIQIEGGRKGLSTPNRSSGLYKHVSSSLTFVSVVLAQRPPHI